MRTALLRILTVAALTICGPIGCMTSNMLEARKIPSMVTINDSQKTTQKIRCVAVLINGSKIPTELNYNLDRSIERHLLVRINQVFSAHQTRILADRLHLDLTHPEDRRQFASRTACSHTLELKNNDNPLISALEIYHTIYAFCRWRLIQKFVAKPLRRGVYL